MLPGCATVAPVDEPPALVPPEPLPDVAGSWTPPAPPFVPLVETAPPAPPPPGYYIPPVYQQPAHPPPPPSARKSHPRRTLVIVLSSVLVFGLIVWGVVAGSLAVVSRSVASGGTRDSSCAGACFGKFQALRMRPTAAMLAILGNPPERYAANGTSSPAGEIKDKAASAAKADGISPECAFVMSDSPTSASNPSSPESRDDPVYFLGEYGTEDNYAEQTVRVFDSAAEASAFLEDLTASITACPSYALDGYDKPIHLAPYRAVTSTPNTGWEEGAYFHYASVDCQHGNLVVRSTFYGDFASTGFTQLMFSRFVTASSVRLAAF